MDAEVRLDFKVIAGRLSDVLTHKNSCRGTRISRCSVCWSPSLNQRLGSPHGVMKEARKCSTVEFCTYHLLSTFCPEDGGQTVHNLPEYGLSILYSPVPD